MDLNRCVQRSRRSGFQLHANSAIDPKHRRGLSIVVIPDPSEPRAEIRRDCFHRVESHFAHHRRVEPSSGSSDAL